MDTWLEAVELVEIPMDMDTKLKIHNGAAELVLKQALVELELQTLVAEAAEAQMEVDKLLLVELVDQE